MRNIFLVLRYEVVTTLQKRSFWITTFLLPALIMVMNLGTQVLAESAFESEEVFVPGETAVPISKTPTRIGYVDQSGLITQLPPGIPTQFILPYPDETAVHTALTNQEIDQYYIVPTDYLQTGKIIFISRDFQPFNVLTEDLFNYILTYNLSGDSDTAAILLDPTFSIHPRNIAPTETNQNDATNPLTFFVPYATMLIFFFLITMSSGFMLQSVTREKENRTAEILLLSLHPRQLMLGKILGLSIIAILQIIVWMAGGLVALDQGQQFLETASQFVLPPGFLIWAVLFFLLGYILYASILGAIGAVAPNAREGNQFTWVVILPLMIPLLTNVAFIESPHGPLPTTLSLIPFTAPVAMMTRLAAGGVPLWQTLTSLAGLALITYFFANLAARFFRADTLLSDASLQWQRFWHELRS